MENGKEKTLWYELSHIPNMTKVIFDYWLLNLFL